MYDMFIEPMEAFAKNEIIPLKVNVEIFLFMFMEFVIKFF